VFLFLMGRTIQCPPLMLALDQIICNASDSMSAKKMGVDRSFVQDGGKVDPAHFFWCRVCQCGSGDS
jgi:hypothetical protein